MGRDLPRGVFAAIPIAAASFHSAQNIAFHEVGRQAIFADPDWQRRPLLGERRIPARGLAVARMAAHITYLSEQALTRKFGRRLRGAPRRHQPVRRHVRGRELPATPGQHLRPPLRRQLLSDDHARDGLFRPRRRTRRRPRRAPSAAPARASAGLVQLRLAVPHGAVARRRPRAEPRRRQCELRRDRERQGPRRLPARRAGFPPHARGLPRRLRRACGARDERARARRRALRRQEHAARSAADRGDDRAAARACSTSAAATAR